MARRVDIPEHAVENIMAVYRSAEPADVMAGVTWYRAALEACQVLADTYDVPTHIAVGVVAALSPNNRWARNLQDAESIIAAYMAGEHMESVSVCTYNAMRAKAWRVLSEAPDTLEGVLVILNGQKIRCFAENIMGVNTCTVDGHARNIAYGRRVSLSGSKFTIGKAEYAALQECYREAGALVGMTAYEMQAVTWVVWRRIHAI